MTSLFKSILVPLDGSSQAERVLPWVRKHAKSFRSEVILLQVLRLVYPMEGLPFPKGGEEARRYLMGIERQFNFEGIPSKFILRGDSVGQSIVETARLEGCDLIALTSGHTSKTIRWLMGGIAEQVLRLSPVSVFILRNGIVDRARVQPRSILVPLDGSSHSRRVLPIAEKLARFHRASLVLVHVLEPGGTSSLGKPRTSDSLKRVSKICEGLKQRGIRAVLRVETGDPAGKIISSVLPSDLLAMTTHGRGGIKRLIFGSVAERVIQHAACPVLVYKEARG
jgi:nucleotide-binding universal stress UspA family protein